MPIPNAERPGAHVLTTPWLEAVVLSLVPVREEHLDLCEYHILLAAGLVEGKNLPLGIGKLSVTALKVPSHPARTEPCYSRQHQHCDSCLGAFRAKNREPSQNSPGFYRDSLSLYSMLKEHLVWQMLP